MQHCSMRDRADWRSFVVMGFGRRRTHFLVLGSFPVAEMMIRGHSSTPHSVFQSKSNSAIVSYRKDNKTTRVECLYVIVIAFYRSVSRILQR